MNTYIVRSHDFAISDIPSLESTDRWDMDFADTTAVIAYLDDLEAIAHSLVPTADICYSAQIKNGQRFNKIFISPSSYSPLLP